MRPYFEKMQGFGKPVKENPANAEEIKKVEQADRQRWWRRRRTRGFPRRSSPRGVSGQSTRGSIYRRSGHLGPPPYALRPHGRRIGDDRRRRRPRQDKRQVVRDHRLRQQGHGGRVDRGPGGQHPPGHGHREKAPLPARLACQLQRREADRSRRRCMRTGGATAPRSSGTRS